jgi:hypothetical protein
MNADLIFRYIKQLEADLADRNQTIAELQRREPDQDRDKVDYFIDLVIARYGLDQYTGNNFKLAPDRMQEIVRAMWAIRPEMKEGAA